MISASASRWAAGSAALLLAGGSALPGADLELHEPAPGVTAPAEEAQPPAEHLDPADGVPADPPVDEPGADDPPVDGAPTDEPPAEDAPTEDTPAEEAPAGDAPADEPEQAGPILVVVPEAVPAAVDGAPGFTLPLGDGGFTWLVDGVPVPELGAAARLVETPDGGWYELSAVALGTDATRLVLAVVADDGHLLLAPDGTTSLVRTILDPRAAAELVAPTALDGAGREDAVVVPDAGGQVVLDDAGQVLEPGTHPVTAEYVDGAATVTLTVTAAEGYRLEAGGTPVEPVPGAGGSAEVILELTDVPAVATDPLPAPVPAPAPTEPEDAAPTPEPELELELAAPLVTVPATAPAPAVPAAVAASVAEPAQEEAALEELPESGPEGLGLVMMLGGLLLGGSWLVLGMRGD